MELRDRLQSTLGDAYSVERELGGGGMSRVFLAQETALGRSVVVKVLTADAIAGISGERFAREVRLAASLQHPNIVPVLTTGVADGIPYYTMPYVRGESLRARMKQGPALPRRQAISILRDLARALQYAHGEGVIHRDIKPDNVLLSGDAAVVTDFGIAKAISLARTSSSGTPDENSGFTLTQAGLTIGTPAYMAPEQAAGDAVDPRGDLYAWGVVAYELLAGEHPFAGRTTVAQLIVAQMTELPAPLAEKAPDIPASLADVVMQCLEKQPDKRPASATELVEKLDTPYDSRDLATHPRLPAIAPAKRTPYKPIAAGLVIVALLAAGVYAYSRRQSTAVAPIAKSSSVAVLPFADDGADSANAYFGEGIADELMTALGKVPGLRVASRTSAIAIGRRRDLDVREIARQLGVSTVVEGTVRRSGKQLRVTAQLTNAADGLTLWSDAYERENKDVFAVQDDITRAIVIALRPELVGGGRSLAQRTTIGPGTSNPEAYDLYLRGLYLIERRGTGVARSAEYFSQAIQKDPGFARAYAGLAGALELFPYFAGVPAERVEARARAAAERSLQLDPALAEPRVALAMAHWHALRWKEAEAEFRRAIAADSTSPVAHTQYGRFLISQGRIPDALREFKTARVLDPLAGTASVWLSYSLARSGDQAAAWEESKRARELDPNLVTTHTILAFDRIALGRLNEARAIAGDITPPIPFNGMIAYILQMTGDTARAAAIRKTLDATPDTTWMIHTARAYAYLATGDTARVLSEMEAGLDRREIVIHWMPFVDRLMDPVRHSARFAAVVRRLGVEGRGLTGPTGGRQAR
ncbi:MAG: protein kinase [Gemmatimonadales bacterium]